MSLICSIYRSSKKQEMYLYVDKKDGLEKVPAALLKTFGEPQHVMTLLLKPERELARVDRNQVELKIKQQGWFLQMPPGKEEYLLDLYNSNVATKH